MKRRARSEDVPCLGLLHDVFTGGSVRAEPGQERHSNYETKSMSGETNKKSETGLQGFIEHACANFRNILKKRRGDWMLNKFGALEPASLYIHLIHV